MIAELNGKVAERREESLVILADGTGIGLEVMVPDRTLTDAGEGIRLFTSLHIATDGPLLTGFESPEELRVFKALLNVNGVGPRMAVRVLSTHPASRIYEALDQEDPKPFQAVSGIGARTANRIILELRGKLVPEDKAPAEAEDDESTREVLEALLGLGYTRTEATIALNQTVGESMPVEARIAAALRDLGSRGRPA
ncbi:MAG: Holliday junction ATP-dependent DNA helicase RuvA [Chloroflexota bacterium]|nr:Holliday junction ATP-dependent DNA helicase RuvA [Chloroflexota bacterium]MDE2898543.1 Holliday junction ATP-dependent DNA helicase RuvA [Chloroflexota bacterium]